MEYADRIVPPDFCQYACGPCPQSFDESRPQAPFLIYPAAPTAISTAIEAAANTLKTVGDFRHLRTWRHLNVSGQIIFCEICEAIRLASCVVADITTLNLNVMFEIGFAIGLDLPVLTIRDPSYIRDRRDFDELGVLDTVGFIDFDNSHTLAEKLAAAIPGKPVPAPSAKLHTDSPVYFLKGRVDTEGAIRLASTLKKSPLRFRTWDPVETPRMSLFEARRQVGSSHAVIGQLLSPHRNGASTHNALCALLAGIAMAEERSVTLLQEEEHRQPIDYRDVVKCYTSPEQIPQLLTPTIYTVVERLQSPSAGGVEVPDRLLEKLDLGDTAAENEIAELQRYFVRTGQFTQAKQGHARLVVGRKGTGKTAIFYGVRSSVRSGPYTTILDLKPEGHQFTKLREAVLSRLTEGLQEHTMTAFWNYIILTELARKIVYMESHYALRDESRRGVFQELKGVYETYDVGQNEDFSERLLHLVDRILDILADVDPDEIGGRVTNELYSKEIHDLGQAICSWLEAKRDVWILVDNIDKGWPTRGTTSTDIVIVRGLLEATRKVQRQLRARDVELKCLVFLRSDIYEHLMRETPDRGKDTAIVLDWDDVETFRELVRTGSLSAPILVAISQTCGQSCSRHLLTMKTRSYTSSRGR